MKKRMGIMLTLAFASLFAFIMPVGAQTTTPPHQTLKSIAASEAKAKASAPKLRSVVPSTISADVAAMQAAADNAVAKANAGVQAAEVNNDVGLWGDIATLYAATATQTAVNKVANDLLTPPPTTTTTTTTTVPPTTTTTGASTTTTTVAPASHGVLGLYAGGVSSAIGLGQTLGLNPLQAYSYYCNGSSGWSGIASCAPPSGLPAGTTLLVGLNLTPSGVGDSVVTSNLSTFQSVARNFKGYNGNVIFRLGWEFDGNWFSWGNGVNGNTPASFASATGAVIPAMKAIMPNAQFDFSDNMGSSTVTQLKAYMGNNASLWNYVGGDHYDSKGSTTGGNMSNMTAAITYASQLNKPFSEGEWGLNGSDDTTYINNEAMVILHSAQASAKWGWPSYTVGPTSYFSAALSINSDITQFPNSLSTFKADFG